MEQITPEIRKKLLIAQKKELTESIVYRNIAKYIKNENNRNIISKIGLEELKHSEIWKSYTGENVKPDKLKIWLYTFIIRFFGISFGIKLMEKGEKGAVINYQDLGIHLPKANEIKEDEQEHEKQLISLINDKFLNYLGSIVLGLNDALVELTGVLAGLTFGLQNSNMIASVGIITGISAAFSMSGSEYLSTKTDNEANINPITASVYTGIAYVSTVILLILPYLLIENAYIALAVCISTAISIIALFNYYTSVAKGYSFKSRFTEMTLISLGVACISFVIGIVVKSVFNINV